jgi:pilus assembly protein CpaB
MRPTVVLGLGLVASLITAILVYRMVGRAPAPAPMATAPEPAKLNLVVVAAGDLPLGTTLEERHLKAVDWPVGATPKNVYSSPQTLVGRVTLARLIGNEPVTNDKLAPVGTKGLLPLIIELGMRAFTIKVNEVTAVNGFIVPGSRVDLLITGDVNVPAELPGGGVGQPEMGTTRQRQTRTLLQNVTVLAMGQLLEPSGGMQPPGSTTTATLLVTPPQSELLALAATEGPITLVLRNFADNEIVASAGKSTQDLFGGGNSGVTRAAVAVPPPPATQTDAVELIRGTDRVTVPF